MKKLVSLLVFFIANIVTSQKLVIDTFAEKWDNSKSYLVKIAESMPEELYDYKPTDREMTFRAQLTHIVENMDWLSGTYFTDEKFQKKDRSNIISKQQLIEEIEKMFDQTKNRITLNSTVDLSQKVDFFAGPKTKLQILNLMQDHVTHHRGQLIVYLNLNQINPPAYAGW